MCHLVQYLLKFIGMITKSIWFKDISQMLLWNKKIGAVNENWGPGRKKEIRKA